MLIQAAGTSPTPLFSVWDALDDKSIRVSHNYAHYSYMYIQRTTAKHQRRCINYIYKAYRKSLRGDWSAAALREVNKHCFRHRNLHLKVVDKIA